MSCVRLRGTLLKSWMPSVLAGAMLLQHLLQVPLVKRLLRHALPMLYPLPPLPLLVRRQPSAKSSPHAQQQTP